MVPCLPLAHHERDRTRLANRPTAWFRNRHGALPIAGVDKAASESLKDAAAHTYPSDCRSAGDPTLYIAGFQFRYSNPMTGMATVRTNRIVIALQIALVSAVTFFALSGARILFGRTAFWMFG